MNTDPPHDRPRRDDLSSPSNAPLTERETRYRTLFGAMDEGFCVVEMVFDAGGRPSDYHFLEFNDAFERMTGITAEAALAGRSARELYPTLEDHWFETYGRVATTGEPIRFENRAEAMGKWFEVHAFRIGGAGSREVGILFKDVSERKRAENERERLLGEARDREAFLRIITDRLPVRVGYIDRDHRYRFLNGEYERQFGFATGEGTGCAVVDLVGREAYEAGRPHIERALGGETHVQEFSVTYPFGTRRVQATYIADPGPDGTILGLVVQVVDVTARYEAERKIAEREELFRTVFEQAPDDAILVMDVQRTITAWNPAAERIVGWSAAEAIGQLADMTFTPEDRAACAPEKEVAAAAAHGKTEDDRWHIRKDGIRFWGSGTMNALHDEGGDVRGYLKVFRDTTERYQETQTLAFLSLLTEAVIDQRDADAILETAERMVGQYVGVGRVLFAEVEQDEDSVVVRKEWSHDVPSIVGAHRIADFGPRAVSDFRSGTTHVSRDAALDYAPGAGLEAIRAIGAMAGIAVPLMKEGRLSALFVVHNPVPRDWTPDEISLVQQVADRMSAEIERARAEAALRASEERFRQIVDLAPGTVWFAEPDGGLSYISQDFYDATGMTPETALPNGWTVMVHPDDLGRVAMEWETARRDETPYDTEFRTRQLDGTYRWISARALPVRDDEGRVTGWLGSNSDIHERKTAEETLRARVEERTAELQRTVQEAEGFNYSISHDLRSPLRAMVSTASILLEDLGPELDEEHRDLLRRQAENAKRMGVLIDELLRLSRLARVPVNRQPLDMTTKARSVAEEVRQADEDNGCAVEVQEGMAATGDPGLVRTVLHNLIGNACKFSPQGGTVTVGKEDEKYFVRDQGVGFDMAYADKLFVAFERLVDQKSFQGTGLGLANVRRIVEKHGGRIWAESEPDRGATFWFTLA